ncbi:MAG: hydroxymethylbilane synthase [Rubripirellula sp.]|nr:hydroxymethylbilane synthase [Rubripirellula sp.]
MKTLRIATRQSPLALWQAEHIAALLKEHGFATVIVPLVSRGDVDMSPIDGTRQVGMFTKRIQQALLDDEGDIAVHSLKDLPTEVDPRLRLAAVPQRETVVDCLVSAAAWTLDQLPDQAKIGTGSRRRGAQLLSVRPDLNILPIRGNVQTRLSKLEAGEFDAIMLAEAGLIRLRMDDLSRSQLSLNEMLPAPGQGALGIEVRSDDDDANEAVAKLDDAAARAAVTAERNLLAALHGGCLAPIAAFARIEADQLRLRAVVLGGDGRERLDEIESLPWDADNPIRCGEQLADTVSKRLVDRGARELITAER